MWRGGVCGGIRVRATPAGAVNGRAVCEAQDVSGPRRGMRWPRGEEAWKEGRAGVCGNASVARVWRPVSGTAGT